MVLTDEIVNDFLFCKYKAYLKMAGHCRDKTDYELVESELYKRSREQFLEDVRSSYKSEQIIYPTSPLEGNFRRRRSQIMLINPQVKWNGFLISFDAIQISQLINTQRISRYIPIMITPKEKLTKNEKISLTIKTLLLNRIVPQFAEIGRIIYGRQLNKSSIKMKDYRRSAQKMLSDLTNMMTENTKPSIMRCDNCSICEFEEDCRKSLIERDDLSLMGCLNATEIFKKNKKGIFTINQLSYNFRPKRFKKIKARGRPFSPELKALAIRDKKTYILDVSHEIKSGTTEIYLDFEGLPEENFIYLIGLIIKDNDSEEKVSLWADSVKNERKIFENFVTTISGYKDSVFYHYGSYETRELKRVMKLYPEIYSALAAILDRTINLLSLFYSSIYPPTYTNELKEIGRFLGFEWTDKHSSGIQSIAWRKHWELYHEDRYKDILLKYNSEDCQALKVIKTWMVDIIERRHTNFDDNLCCIDDIKQESTYKFGKIEFLNPDFAVINNCAYFDYQRQKIFLRTNAKIKKIVARQNIIQERALLQINSFIKISFPERCPVCGKNKFYRHDHRKRLCVDLKFAHNGIKRWVTHYDTGRFKCRSCNLVFTPDNFKKIKHFGRKLYVWAITQHICYGLSIRNITQMLSDYFNIDLTVSALQRTKAAFALEYRETYNELFQCITNGKLVHIDETQVNITDDSSGYVWTFANMDTVCYLFKPNREAVFLKELLKEFQGVVISDFYTGYDSIVSPQQKCLIHLIRDLNDDLCKNQFDMDFKEIVMQFGKLLRTIIETIETYGLKRRNLNKHRKAVEDFFELTLNATYHSELAMYYQKRFYKNRDKLFTFMNYDEIPWNNNNAEHAIKHFVMHRRNVDGLFSKKTIEEFLILLSIYQTCKYRGLNFMKYLLSEEKSLLGYFNKHYRL